MPDVRFSEGQYIAPWKLKVFLGAGGNSEVWLAEHDEGTVAAVKFSVRERNDSRYSRFRDEIKLHERLGARPGVLPMWDHHLPDKPNKRNPSWFSMPEATPIRKALLAKAEETGQQLEQVIEALASIAETLSRLAEEEGVYHRDLKPSNLYWYDGEWVIGDLGLAYFDDKDAVTGSSERLGPLYFHAPEMLAETGSAQLGPADVYSLGKTLTVLATGQEYPPFGQQRVGVRHETIEGWLSHPKARLVDALLERATAADPAARPTMSEFARELRACLNPIAVAPTPEDLSQIIANLRAQTFNDTRNAALRNQRWALTAQTARKFDAYVRRYLVSLKKQGLDVTSTLESTSQAERNRTQDLAEGVYMNGHADFRTAGMGNRDMDSGRHYRYDISPDESNKTHVLWCLVSVYAFTDGHANLLAAHYIHAAHNRLLFWCDHRIFPLGSALEDHAVASLAHAFTTELPRALQAMAELSQYNRPIEGEISVATKPSNDNNLVSRLARVKVLLARRGDLTTELHNHLGVAFRPLVQRLAELGAPHQNAMLSTPVFFVRHPVPPLGDALEVLRAGINVTQRVNIHDRLYPALTSGIDVVRYDDDKLGILAGHLLSRHSHDRDMVWSESHLLSEAETDLPTLLLGLGERLAENTAVAYDRYLEMQQHEG